ncbi:hypothetical protein [Nitrosomonas communis]|nr:hypothetical protein [Nitrosomonas communis]
MREKERIDLLLVLVDGALLIHPSLFNMQLRASGANRMWLPLHFN